MNTSSSGQTNNNPRGATLLLRGAAILLLSVGAGLLLWLGDKVFLHPWDRIADDLNFWLPFSVTVTIGVCGLAYLFLRAASRVDAGEDLFGNSYRRRPEPRERQG